MSAALAEIPQSFIQQQKRKRDEQKLRRVMKVHWNAKVAFPEMEFNICGSEWAWVRDWQGRGWWVNLRSGTVLSSHGQVE